ncbi:MAG: porin family protein [Bacteroidaceae bacterium]
MKKIISILAVALCLVTAMPAQAQIKLGVKAGLNLSKADFSDASSNFDAKNFTGYFVGPMVEITIPVIGIGVDGALLYSHSGMKFADSSVGNRTTSIDRNTIQIPLNVKYSIGLSSLAAVYFAVGPEFGFNLSSDKFSSLTNGDLSFKKSNLSFNLGAGVKLLSHLQVGLNYNIPLGKTADFDDVTSVVAGATTSAITSKNKTWQIVAAYIF